MYKAKRKSREFTTVSFPRSQLSLAGLASSLHLSESFVCLFVFVFCLSYIQWPEFLVVLNKSDREKRVYSIFPEADIWRLVRRGVTWSALSFGRLFWQGREQTSQRKMEARWNLLGRRWQGAKIKLWQWEWSERISRKQNSGDGSSIIWWLVREKRDAHMISRFLDDVA